MKLHVLVFDARQYTGKMTFTANGQKYEYTVSAQASPDIANAVNPPAGEYILTKKATPKGMNESYGNHILFFEATAGDALSMSNYNGRFILTIHGGETDENDHLLATDGGIRLKNEDMEELIGLIGNQSNVTLTVEEKEIHFLNKIGHAKVSYYQLPQVSYKQNFYQQNSYTSDGITDNIFFWLWAYDVMEGNNVSTVTQGFDGFGGGRTDGGGAGGSWTNDNTSVDNNAPNTNYKDLLGGGTTSQATDIPVIVNPFADTDVNTVPVTDTTKTPDNVTEPDNNEQETPDSKDNMDETGTAY